MSEEQKVIIKKIKPYPILTKLEKEGTMFYGNIVKLTLTGFLIELNETFVRVAEKYDSSFEIPVLGDSVQMTCKVVKTYDQFKDPTSPAVTPEGLPAKSSAVVRMAELHFRELTKENKDVLKKFLIAIGQIPR